jgi:hypothetical protein
MLGFVLSEHDGARCTTSLSADADTEASSDGVGLELGANTGSDMEFMMLASMNPNSGFSAGPGWTDWDAAGPSSAMVAENDYVGDGTIDPSVLGGAGFSGVSLGGGRPGKAVFRLDGTAGSDDHIGYHRSPFMRARGKDKYLDNGDVEDEGDVMGLLFEDPPDGDFVSRPPSVRGAGGKGKNKDKATVAGADTMDIDIDVGARTGGTRIRRKSWRKALADDDDKTDHSEDTDTEANDTVGRRHSSTMSRNLSSSLGATYCHHCRRKTFRPKMRCTHIRKSTGEQCRKMYCDLCIERRYVFLH